MTVATTPVPVWAGHRVWGSARAAGAVSHGAPGGAMLLGLTILGKRNMLSPSLAAQDKDEDWVHRGIVGVTGTSANVTMSPCSQPQVLSPVPPCTSLTRSLSQLVVLDPAALCSCLLTLTGCPRCFSDCRLQNISFPHPPQNTHLSGTLPSLLLQGLKRFLAALAGSPAPHGSPSRVAACSPTACSNPGFPSRPPHMVLLWEPWEHRPGLLGSLDLAGR